MNNISSLAKRIRELGDDEKITGAEVTAIRAERDKSNVVLASRKEELKKCPATLVVDRDCVQF